MTNRPTGTMLSGMKDPLYTKDILRLAADIPHLRRLDAPDESITKVSPICGSRVKVDVVIKDGIVTDYGQEVRACALGQAAAAIMGEGVMRQPLQTFPALLDQLTEFLKGDASVPDAPWQGLQVFAPAKAHKSRHASILLTFQAMAEIAQKANDGATAQ